MHAHEIIVRKMQSYGRFQVPQLLRKSVCQVREPAHLPPHREILPLNMRRGDKGWIGSLGQYRLWGHHGGVTTLCYLDNLLAPLRVTNAGGIIPACEST